MKRPVILSLAAILLASSSAQAEVAFSSASNVVHYDLRGRTNASAAADYDGDGVVDQAVVASKGLGKALEWTVTMSSTGETVRKQVGSAGNKALAGCDMDGDGKADMVSVGSQEIKYTSSLSNGKIITIAGGGGTDYACWDVDGSGTDSIVAATPDGTETYRAAQALSCGVQRELARPYLWKNNTSSHINQADIRQKFRGSFIGERRRATIPASSQVKILDKSGNIVGYTCKYAQLGVYQFRYYNGTCPSGKRANNTTIRNRAVSNTGSPTVFLDVGRGTCLKLSNGPTVSRQGAVK